MALREEILNYSLVIIQLVSPEKLPMLTVLRKIMFISPEHILKLEGVVLAKAFAQTFPYVALT
jgi:hypothetical protein